MNPTDPWVALDLRPLPDAAYRNDDSNTPIFWSLCEEMVPKVDLNKRSSL